MKRLLKKGVTLLELMVVLVIIAILSTIAVGIYTKEILRAKYARTRAEIRTLEIAIAQYEIDTGQLPPSSSGSSFAPNALNPTNPATGCAYLTMSLRTSLNNNLYAPLGTRWSGPYVDWDYNKLGDDNGVPITDPTSSATPAGVSFLDPFGTPYQYIRSSDYLTLGGTQLPSSNVFSVSETYFNPSTFQIISYGANRTSLAPPEKGLEPDDITNFRSFE